MKVPIIEAWGMLSNDENIAYISDSTQMALVTPQYEHCLRDFGTQKPQKEKSEKVKRLMTIIEAKDRENVQLKQSVEVNKDLTEKNKKSYEEMREKHQKLKRKFEKLYNQVEHMRNPYSRKSKDAIIDRLKNLMTLYEIVFEK